MLGEGLLNVIVVVVTFLIVRLINILSQLVEINIRIVTFPQRLRVRS